MNRNLVASLCVLSMAGCLGARSVAPKSYYVLHKIPPEQKPQLSIRGLVRVRDMDADAVYEKFQFVVRKSPYELRYSDGNVWAVKPDSMIADVLASGLAHARAFTAVTRTLGESRPDYSLGGKLNAIEVYDSGDIWYAHLALSIRLTRFRDGEVLMAFEFDERKEVPGETFSQTARAISELLAKVLAQALQEVERLGDKGSVDTILRSPDEPAIPLSIPVPKEDKAPNDKVIMVPEESGQ